MAGPQIYPLADAKSQWFGNVYDGSPMDADKGVLHTTETTGWPGYKGGASAPHITGKPDFINKRLVWHQHYPVDKSSRALMNIKGSGVETNTEDTFQIELIGTCDRATSRNWSVEHIYWPEAPDWALRDLAKLMAWLNVNHDIPLTSGLTFYEYPGSYANGRGQRMSFTKWNAFKGWCGHQHVPENCVHPDTLVLAGDSRWVRAGDIKTGDRLVGFDEENKALGSTGGRRFREAIATVHGTVEKDCYRVTAEDGQSVVASSDHKWLVTFPYVNHGSRLGWVETKDLDSSKHRLKSLGVEPWEERADKESGWLAGAIDCDGAVVFNIKGDSSVLFGQAENRTDVLNRFKRGIVAADLEIFELTRRTAGYAKISTQPFTDLRVKGGLWKIVSLLAQLGPEKFELVRNDCWAGRVVGKTTTTTGIASVEHVGPQPVVSLETSAGTYVAQGLLCHNSHGDPGDLDIARLLGMARAIVNPTTTSPEEDDMPNLSQMSVPNPYGDENRTGSRQADLVVSEGTRYAFAGAQAVKGLAAAFGSFAEIVVAFIVAERGADAELSKLIQAASDKIAADVAAIGADLDSLSEHLGNEPVA